MGASLSTNQFPVEGRTVLIPGGSRGMGLEAGRQLASKGAHVVIVARDPSRLQSGLEYIAAAASSPDTQRFHSIVADLTDREAAARIIAEVVAWNPNAGAPPDVVWCCQGTSHPTMFLDTDLEQFHAQMNANYFASVYMAQAALKAWLRPTPTTATQTSDDDEPKQAPAPARQPARHLIFTSSFLAFYPVAGYAPYNPSKAALRTLSDSLSQELQLYQSQAPVRVHTVFPATILTESFEAEQRVKSDMTKMLEEADEGQAPDAVARRAIRGLEAGHELVTTDFMTRFVSTATLGASIRGGYARGFVDWVLGCLALFVMVIVRADMDGKVRSWGRKHGDSNMKSN